MRDFLNITLFLLLAACSAEEKAEKSEISRAKDMPKVGEILEGFHAQENRLQISVCEFNYNDSSFRLGVSVDEMVDVLGPYDYFNRGYYVWKNVGVVFASTQTREERASAVLDIVEVNFSIQVDERDAEKYRHLLERNKNYILFNGVPINHQTTVQEFFEYSMYDYDDFKVSDYSYQYMEKCPGTYTTLSSYFESRGGWNYGGGGHLRYKTTINRENENTVSRIGFQASSE